MYQVIESKTGYVISEHTTQRRAMLKADRLDLAIGGYRYRVQKRPEPKINIEKAV